MSFHPLSQPLDPQGCLQNTMSLQILTLTPVHPKLFPKRVRNGAGLIPVTLHLKLHCDIHGAPRERQAQGQVYEVTVTFNPPNSCKRRHTSPRHCMQETEAHEVL